MLVVATVNSQKPTSPSVNSQFASGGTDLPISRTPPVAKPAHIGEQNNSGSPEARERVVQRRDSVEVDIDVTRTRGM